MERKSFEEAAISAAMRAYRKVNLDFKQKWDEWKQTVSKKSCVMEPETVGEARKGFLAAGEMLWGDYLLPIDDGIRGGDKDSIDAAIVFLGIDVHCFRTGYLKGMWLRRLKRLPLREDQKDRLRQIFIARLVSRVAGREMVEWNRLMIRIANDEDLKNLTELKKHPNERIRWRAERTGRVLVNSRVGRNLLFGLTPGS